jgi:hypothetical protein
MKLDKHWRVVKHAIIRVEDQSGGTSRGRSDMRKSREALTETETGKDADRNKIKNHDDVACDVYSGTGRKLSDPVYIADCPTGN